MDSLEMNDKSVIEKLHSINLEMIKYIDSLCKTNNINYMLAFGSMLGAVRHNGFIPWDDDFDIMMLLDDYKRFKKSHKEQASEYFLQDTKTEKECPFVFAKLRKNNTYMYDICANTLNMHEGIWIDIFILINACKSDKGTRVQHKLVQVYQSIKCKYRYLNDKENYDVSFSKKILYNLPNPLYKLIEKSLFSLIKSMGSSKSQNYYMLGNFDLDRSLISKKWYDNLVDRCFEDTKLPISKYYDEYLKSLYGDYMKPVKYSGHADISNIKF